LEASHVVYLNFADGTEGVAPGADDDATLNLSRLCATEAFDAWLGAQGCGDREACAEAIRARVATYFLRYDVSFVTLRPSSTQPYTMVVVAPPNKACTFGRRGVSYADCSNANPGSLAFAFDCDRDPGACAVLIAHEAAHSFGLVHVSDNTDIMTSAPENPELEFKSATFPTLPNDCGLATQSSDRALELTLGPNRVAVEVR
jgi:hypothetical protein